MTLTRRTGLGVLVVAVAVVSVLVFWPITGSVFGITVPCGSTLQAVQVGADPYCRALGQPRAQLAGIVGVLGLAVGLGLVVAGRRSRP